MGYNGYRLQLGSKRHQFKSIINKVIDKIAPLKKINERKDKTVPWFDSELHRAQILCLKLYKIFKLNNSRENHEAYKIKRNEYQKVFRQKRIEFYTKKTTKDFGSSKKFWEFYASAVNIKKDRSTCKIPKSINVENELVEEPGRIANEFNKFFSSFSAGDEAIPVKECANFILNNFI